MKTLRAIGSTIAFALALSGAHAGSACRPVQTLFASSTVEIEPAQTALSPRLEAELAEDLVLSDDAASLGLGPARRERTLEQPATVRPLSRAPAVVGGRAKLAFDEHASGPAVVASGGRRYLLQFSSAGPVDANGGALELRPVADSDRAFTLAGGARLVLDPAGQVVVRKGARLTWQLGDNPKFEFALLRPTSLEETRPLASSEFDFSVERPARLLPGGTIRLKLRAPGYDFRARPLSFCFAIAPQGQPGLFTSTAPGRLVSESADGAIFEAQVPPALARAAHAAVPGQVLDPSAPATDWLGRHARVRVTGLDGDKVVFDAAQGFIVSNYWIAFWSGFVLIFVLLLASALIFRGPSSTTALPELGNAGGRRRRPSPVALLGLLARQRDGRFSLSNVQIMLWTLLVLYAFCFVWVANGVLLDLSSGVLLLLGISGGASVLSRGIDKFGGEASPPPGGEARMKDLVTNPDGEFDLLRFQMLGFTLFTLAYSFVSVIKSEGLPEIPDNLYLLMGISNGAYLGGKVTDQIKPKDGSAADVPSGFEASLTAAAIQELQRGLQLAPTGRLDEATRSAVVAYKREQGIVPADGSVNALLLEHIAGPR